MNARVIAVCAVIVAVICAAFALTSSSSPAVGSSNAPGWHPLEGGNSPYNFPSVSTFCHGNDLVYVTSFSNNGAQAGGDIFVVANAPECKE